MRRQCLQMLLCQQTEMKKNQVEKRPSKADVYLAEAAAERALDVTDQRGWLMTQSRERIE